MTAKTTQISTERLVPLVEARNKAIALTQAAEAGVKDARMAEMEFKVHIQQLYLENGLNKDCRIDISTGVVTWPEEEVVVASGVAEVEDKPKKRVKKAAKTEVV